MRRSTKLGAMVPLVAVLALAGCGGGGGGAPTSGTAPTTGAPTIAPTTGAPTAPAATQGTTTGDLPDPCALITVAEATIAIAGPLAAAPGVEEGVGTPDLGTGRQCTFKASREAQAMVTVFPNPGELWDTYKLQQGQFGPIKDLAGAGEKAFTVGNYECNVVQGAVIMVVTLAPGDAYAEDPEPRMVQLCHAAAARL
jgi:hypothetical protein